MLKNKTVYIISPEPWGVNFVSKHHYAHLLSEKNNQVFFLNPPSQKTGVINISTNLFVVDYRIPRGVNKLPSFFKKRMQKYWPKE